MNSTLPTILCLLLLGFPFVLGCGDPAIAPGPIPSEQDALLSPTCDLMALIKRESVSGPVEVRIGEVSLDDGTLKNVQAVWDGRGLSSKTWCGRTLCFAADASIYVFEDNKLSSLGNPGDAVSRHNLVPSPGGQYLAYLVMHDPPKRIEVAVLNIAQMKERSLGPLGARRLFWADEDMLLIQRSSSIAEYDIRSESWGKEWDLRSVEDSLSGSVLQLPLIMRDGALWLGDQEVFSAPSGSELRVLHATGKTIWVRVGDDIGRLDASGNGAGLAFVPVYAVPAPSFEDGCECCFVVDHNGFKFMVLDDGLRVLQLHMLEP